MGLSVPLISPALPTCLLAGPPGPRGWQPHAFPVPFQCLGPASGIGPRCPAARLGFSKVVMPLPWRSGRQPPPLPLQVQAPVLSPWPGTQHCHVAERPLLWGLWEC